MFENIGWIVEAKIRQGKKAEFEAVMSEIVAKTREEQGTLNYQYYLSEEGDVLVYERFADVASAHIHVSNWDTFAERWVAAATPIRMVHLGELPEDLRARHSALAPLWLKPFGGFARSV
ncbi:putative quinol monooxygenase [Pseudoalteromonas xiamenensis]|uniref:putative quinol monooxygenase n=1 Tax=Pseudoalteromonas xiamenensis TaxID=882626 RepID=UPI0035E55F31